MKLRLNAYDLEIAIHRATWGSSDLSFNNVFMWGNFESDYVKVTQSGYIYEYEIKMSKSDYKADFEKHYKASKHNEGTHRYETVTCNKHSMIADGRSGLKGFSFVVPEGLIAVENIPEYAGLYYVEECGNFRAECIKEPPRLKAVKLDDKRKIDLLMKTYNKYSGIQLERRSARIDEWLAEKRKNL